jgi:hypothetical protein
VSVLKESRDDIDRAVFEAYGWGDLIPALVGKPGATMPSPHKSPEQEAAEEELLTRLVALNKERAAEEARGIVRWLRPEYQIPRLGKKVAQPDGEQTEADVSVAAAAQRPKWRGMLSSRSSRCARCSPGLRRRCRWRASPWRSMDG